MRRYGRILQDNGDGSYDILVDRFGGEGAGQYRTDTAEGIGKIATAPSLAEELAANAAVAEQEQRFKRAQEMVTAANAFRSRHSAPAPPPMRARRQSDPA
jgi:hypothetical protein